MKTQTFVAVIAFKDGSGEHAANSEVELPAETDSDLQEIATLLNYGVVKTLTKD